MPGRDVIMYHARVDGCRGNSQLQRLPGDGNAGSKTRLVAQCARIVHLSNRGGLPS